MFKITPAELNRRLSKLKSEGKVDLSCCRTGEVIDIFTEPATYSLKVVGNRPVVVEVTSLQDQDFLEPRVCLFLGSVWDNVEFKIWANAPFKVDGCLFKDGYPVLQLQGCMIVLPKIYQIKMGGMPFFQTAVMPD